MQFDIPENVQFVLDNITGAGYEAYIVGGCVRDLLLGITPNDFDVTTNALPMDIKRIFGHTADTGIKHGTVTVIVERQPIEVTTFRTESGYSDSRHPQSVSFVSDIKSDLSRRDFTVNAMAYNQSTGLVDCFGGKEDLKAGILKAVGEPSLRFREDALRIMRLFRFASTLSFTPEENTLKAALSESDGLKNISAERIFSELKKTANGKNAKALLPLLKCGALNFLCLYDTDLFDFTALPCGELRLFALFNLCSNNFDKTLSLLKCSNDFKNYCFNMKELLKQKPPATAADIKRRLTFAKDEFCDYLCYINTLCGIDTADIKALYNGIIKANEPYTLQMLKINGNDLIAIGTDGVKVGAVLKKLLDAVIENPALNEHDTLISLAKTLI